MRGATLNSGVPSFDMVISRLSQYGKEHGFCQPEALSIYVIMCLFRHQGDTMHGLYLDQKEEEPMKIPLFNTVQRHQPLHGDARVWSIYKVLPWPQRSLSAANPKIKGRPTMRDICKQSPARQRPSRNPRCLPLLRLCICHGRDPIGHAVDHVPTLWSS